MALADQQLAAIFQRGDETARDLPPMLLSDSGFEKFVDLLFVEVIGAEERGVLALSFAFSLAAPPFSPLFRIHRRHLAVQRPAKRSLYVSQSTGSRERSRTGVAAAR